MGQILLGLDIGTASIKGVRLSKGFRGLRLLDFFEQAVPMVEAEGLPVSPLPVGPLPIVPLNEGQIETLKDLISKGKIRKGDLIALSLPGDFLSTREMTLPFSDLKKVQQVAPFEIEGELPFDLESVSFDYMILKNRQKPIRNQPDGTEPKQETHLLVSAIPNNTLREYLNLLQPIGIDPAWIGTSALSLYAFSKYFLGIEADQTAETLMIDIGATRTVLCHTALGGLNWIRTIPMGGNFLTEALVKTSDLTWEAAEKIKSEIDLNMEDPTDEQSIMSLEAIEVGIAQLAAEIEKSIRMLPVENGGDFPNRNPDERAGNRRLFHLCGKGSRLKGLQSLLSNILEMEPIEVDIEKGSLADTVSGIETVPPDLISPVYAQAFGLALQESDGPPINFRQGEFVFGKETRERRDRLVAICLFALFLFGVMGGDLYLHYQKKERQYQTLKRELRSAFTQTFPNVRNIVNEVEQTRSAITELHKTGAFLGIGEQSPLAVLKEITEAIPDTLKVDVHNLVIDSGTVRIQAQTDTFESVDRIRSGLLAVKHFRQVEVSDAKATANKSHIRFRIKMTLIERGKGGKNRRF